MKDWLKNKLAEYKLALHLGAINGYQKLLETGYDENYCFRGISKHFMKALEAFTYLVSVGKRAPTPELNEELERLDNMMNNL